jgi:hypothetical protein
MNMRLLAARPGGRLRLYALLVVLGVLLLPLLVGAARARAADPPRRPAAFVVAGWYPAERMCEMDAADFGLGLAWSCARSADRSGWELRIEASRR